MLPLKRILCTTDFSDPSFEAMEVAGELAQHFSSELIVIHVLPPLAAEAMGYVSHPAFDVQEYQQEMERSSSKVLEENIEKRIPKGVSAKGMVLLGNPAEKILHAANAESVDLIVIATRGQTGFKRFVFGSVAEKVVRHAGLPVLTIGGPQEEE